MQKQVSGLLMFSLVLGKSIFRPACSFDYKTAPAKKGGLMRASKEAATLT